MKQKRTENEKCLVDLQINSTQLLIPLLLLLLCDHVCTMISISVYAFFFLSFFSILFVGLFIVFHSRNVISRQFKRKRDNRDRNRQGEHEQELKKLEREGETEIVRKQWQAATQKCSAEFKS